MISYIFYGIILLAVLLFDIITVIPPITRPSLSVVLRSIGDTTIMLPFFIGAAGAHVYLSNRLETMNLQKSLLIILIWIIYGVCYALMPEKRQYLIFYPGTAYIIGQICGAIIWPI